MANDINVMYNGSETIYAIIRRVSNGKVWNGTALETWADANIATYDVALSSLGGNLWGANIPASLANTVLKVLFFEQAGASPAIDDFQFASPQDIEALSLEVITGTSSGAGTITGRQVVSMVRRQMSDTDATYYRSNDFDMLEYLAAGVSTTFCHRPDLYFKTDGTTNTGLPPTTLSETLEIPVKWLPVLADYIAYRIFDEDDADKGNIAKRDSHYKAYMMGVMGGIGNG